MYEKMDKLHGGITAGTYISPGRIAMIAITQH